MKKIKFFSCLLSSIISLGLLCSCSGTAGPQGPQGPQGIQGPQGPQGESSSSFLTGKGQPENDLGNIGDSYLNIDGEEWGFYIKDNDGWKLLGFIETEPAPPDLSYLDGLYVLSHMIGENDEKYEIGDTFFFDFEVPIELSNDMFQIQLENGIGTFTMSHAGETRIQNILSTAVEGNEIIITYEHPVVTGTTAHINISYQTIGNETYISFMFASGTAYLKKIA